MALSIQQFDAFDTSVLDKAIISFLQDPAKFTEFTQSVESFFLNAMRIYVKEALESYEALLLASTYRRAHWEVVKKDTREILTVTGSISFERRLYENRKTGERCYLLDHLIGLEPHEKITEGAKARILEEAVQTSYRRGGINASTTDRVSKNTVKKIIHGLSFPAETGRPEPAEKRKVETLYIDADEDHISLQFQKEKGDLTVSEQGMKLNNAITKLIYVYEGVEADAPNSQRKHLVNPYYFCSTSEGAANSELWDEVYTYISRVYDVKNLKTVYLNSDGAAWIKAGKDRLAGLKHVLDEFHLNKYLKKMTGHLCDSSDEVMKELKKAIMENKRKSFHNQVKKLYKYAETPQVTEKIREGGTYILENWEAAATRLNSRDIIFGCSAEGHVSHVLSSRMSSRPMGWSRKGADKMARLRAYYYNKGQMLELIRYSKKKLPKAAGAEKDRIFSAHEMQEWEASAKKRNGKYYDAIQASVNLKSFKTVYFNNGIWGF